MLIEIIEHNEWTVIQKQEKFIVKWGIDPSKPYLHLGHLSCLYYLKTLLQKYENCFVKIIIGTATVFSNDPTSKKYNNINNIQVKNNTDNIYKIIKQLFRHFEDRYDIFENHRWLQNITISDSVLIHSLKCLKVSDLIQKFGHVSANSILYPFMQAYDSKILESDVEVGGTDQRFNILFQRKIYKILQMKKQICIFLPLLTDTKNNKMSKSINGAIFLDNPINVYKRLLSLNDKIFENYMISLGLFKRSLDKKHMANNLIKDVFNNVDNFEKNKDLWFKTAPIENFKIMFIEYNKYVFDNQIDLISLISDVCFCSKSEAKRKIIYNTIKQYASDNSFKIINKFKIMYTLEFYLSFGKYEKYKFIFKSNN